MCCTFSQLRDQVCLRLIGTGTQRKEMPFVARLLEHVYIVKRAMAPANEASMAQQTSRCRPSLCDPSMGPFSVVTVRVESCQSSLFDGKTTKAQDALSMAKKNIIMMHILCHLSPPAPTLNESDEMSSHRVVQTSDTRRRTNKTPQMASFFSQWGV